MMDVCKYISFSIILYVYIYIFLESVDLIMYHHIQNPVFARIDLYISFPLCTLSNHSRDQVVSPESTSYMTAFAAVLSATGLFFLVLGFRPRWGTLLTNKA